jgi:chemotaxis protein CheC
MLGGPLQQSAIDRVRELSSIGAGHAATALGNLLGVVCRMRVPLVRVLPAARVGDPFVVLETEDDREASGVFFEVEGGLGGVLALLFSARTRDLLVSGLLGQPAAEADPEVAASALREFGNIAVSHVASAMADTIGVAVIPSVPLLVERDAQGALSALLSMREPDRATVRVETEIGDRAGEIRAALVYVPDHTTVIARPQGF